MSQEILNFKYQVNDGEVQTITVQKKKQANGRIGILLLINNARPDHVEVEQDNKEFEKMSLTQQANQILWTHHHYLNLRKTLEDNVTLGITVRQAPFQFFGLDGYRVDVEINRYPVKPYKSPDDVEQIKT